MDLKKEAAILEHLKIHASLSKEEVDIEETPIDFLPKHLSVFYVVKKESYHNVYYYYVFYDQELFSSIEEDSFERLLRKFKFVENKTVDAVQTVTLFSLLKVRMRDIEVVSEKDLAPKGLLERYRDQVSVPSLKSTDGEIEVIFWTWALRTRNLERWTLFISRDYEVRYETRVVAKLS